MSQDIQLNAQKKQRRPSKGTLKAERQQGRMPAVIYGAGKDPVNIWIRQRDLTKALYQAHSANVLLRLKISEQAGDGGGNAEETVLLKELDRDVVTSAPLHADFMRVSLTQTVEVNIPVHTTGESVGVKKGGILEHIMREIKISCLAEAIPGSITINITDLDIGHSIQAKDLPLPEGVKLLTGADHAVINVVAPRAEEEKPAAAVETQPTEPQVIAKGKKEEEKAAGETPVKTPGKEQQAPQPAAPKK